MIAVVLDKNKHDRKSFDCGIKPLNSYLQLMASQQSLKDNSRTYVIENKENSKKIIGFYTLTMIGIDLKKLPLNLQKKHRDNNSVALIARLAVDKQYANQGIGSWLLVDALNKILSASDVVGFSMIVVDAKDGVMSFYEKFGFTPFMDENNKLFITIADVRASFTNTTKS